MVQQCWFGPALFFRPCLSFCRAWWALFSRLRCLFCSGLFTAPLCRGLSLPQVQLLLVCGRAAGLFSRRCSFCLGFAAALCRCFSSAFWPLRSWEAFWCSLFCVLPPRRSCGCALRAPRNKAHSREAERMVMLCSKPWSGFFWSGQALLWIVPAPPNASSSLSA